VRGGTLRIDQSKPPQAVSPLYFLKEPENETQRIIVQLFDRLVELRPGSLDPKPGLATHWEITPDGKTYTFDLRKAQFSNGTPVTSADVAYSLNRVRKSFFADLLSSVSAIKTPDAATVVIELAEPAPALIYYLAFPGTSIVPEQLVKSIGDDAFNSKPIGSGPFVLAEWRRDQEVRLVRNERYWRKGLPYLDEVRMNVNTNGNTRVLNIESGTVDVADQVPFSQVARINKGNAAKVLLAPGADINSIWINNNKKPFDDPLVRQALNYATPVESIIKVVFHGLAPRANTVIPKVKYWTDESKPYPFDLDKAKELIAESTVPNGFSATLSYESTDRASEQIAQIVKQEWAKIGVNLKIKPLPSGNDEFTTGKYELELFQEFTTDVPVDDQFAQLVFASPETNNLFTWYRNPTTERLAKEALVETDEDERAGLFAQMHVEAMKNPPVVPLVYTPDLAAVRANVHDFNYMLNSWWVLDSVWVD
jgi:peptide/nickel transport system substrate-binding protein